LRCLAADPAGRLWVGLTAWWGPDHPYPGGLVYCQGDRVRVFPGPPAGPNQVPALAVDRAGTLWVGLWNAEAHHGLYRYRAGRLERVDGAACPLSDRVPIQALYADQEGGLWVGTSAGLWRYEGQQWAHWGMAEGLSHEIVTAIHQTRDGVLWVGTEGGGVGVYDGQVFQTITLPGEAGYNTIHALHEDRQGSVWLATQAGLVRYTSQREPPTVVLEEVRADRTYAFQERLEIGTTAGALQVHFRGHSPVGYAAQLVYRYRLHGRDPDWRLTRHSPVPYPALEPGAYRFEVQAVDPDLNYSEAAIVELTVVPDPRQQALQELLSGDGESFVGQSPALARVQQQLEQVADSDLTVLILGETGTGKGLAARTLHRLSPRRTGPFVPVNGGALPEHLVESELFGHERGSFTGAHARKLGKVELAAAGTLFLDEIGDMSPEAQIRLLHLLEEGTYERVGGTERLTADVRVVAATNRDLHGMVEEGRFREDLYFRLNVFPVRLPPLRERRQDLSLLADFFVTKAARHLNKRVRGVTAEALARLQGYDWPGNVRELQHTLERAVILCQEERVSAEDLALERGSADTGRKEGGLTLEEVERRHILSVLEQTDGAIKGPHGAAAILGKHEATLRHRMKKLGIHRR
jgi:DNA-binding NtrC family response regulator